LNFAPSPSGGDVVRHFTQKKTKMNYKEAKIIALEWFANLNLPNNLEGKQVNLLSYITDPIDSPLFRQKRTLLGIELRKRGVKSIGEIDNWTFEQSEYICEY